MPTDSYTVGAYALARAVSSRSNLLMVNVECVPSSRNTAHSRALSWCFAYHFFWFVPFSCFRLRNFCFPLATKGSPHPHAQDRQIEMWRRRK